MYKEIDGNILYHVVSCVVHCIIPFVYQLSDSSIHWDDDSNYAQVGQGHVSTLSNSATNVIFLDI